MRSMVTILLLSSALFSAACNKDKTGLEYKINKNGTITAYEGHDTELILPSWISGVWVTAIGDNVFERKGLTSVTIPNSVISIGKYAFHDNRLISVTIPDSVRSIGKGAFAKNGITSVTISGSMVSIGEGVFLSNPVMNITIGNDIVTEHAFMNDFTNYYYNNGKMAGTYKNANSKWSITPAAVVRLENNAESGGKVAPQYEGDFWTDKRGTITDYNGIASSIVIPARIGDMPVAAVGDGAFLKKQITSVAIPDTVEYIGAYAFAKNLLRSVVIPSSVSLIGVSAFEDNPLTSITIGANVTLRFGAFSENFVDLYNNDGKRAGTYLYHNDKWGWK